MDEVTTGLCILAIELAAIAFLVWYTWDVDWMEH